MLLFLLDVSYRLFCGLLMVALPAALGIALLQHDVSQWKIFRMGALCFVSSQVFHVPFNLFLLTPFLKSVFGENLGIDHAALFLVPSILYGVSAGVFEETARWLVYRYWMMNHQNDRTTKFHNSLMLGAGHGGCEAFLVGLMAVLTLVIMTVCRSVEDLSKIFHDPDTAQHMQDALETYWGTSWYIIMMAPIERIMAMTIHLACSLLVWNGFVVNSKKWLGSAIALHSAVDAVAVFVLYTHGTCAVELALFLTFFPGAIGIIYYFYKRNERLELIVQEENLEVPLVEGDEYHEFPAEEERRDDDEEVGVDNEEVEDCAEEDQVQDESTPSSE